MNIMKLKTFGLSCVCFLCVVFSVTASATDLDLSESGVAIEGWSPVGGRELPILSFEESRVDDEILQDIRVENVTVDEDGSTRFQLTHSGPMSRQAFAHVRRVEQDDGFTRSIITNIADGTQMEFLARTTEDPARGRFGKSKDGDSLIQIASGEKSNLQCPWCYWAGGLITEATCVAGMVLGNYQCRLNCQQLGGVKEFRSGICGMYNTECICMIDPKRIADEIGLDP